MRSRRRRLRTVRVGGRGGVVGRDAPTDRRRGLFLRVRRVPPAVVRLRPRGRLGGLDDESVLASVRHTRQPTCQTSSLSHPNILGHELIGAGSLRSQAGCSLAVQNVTTGWEHNSTNTSPTGRRLWTSSVQTAATSGRSRCNPAGIFWFVPLPLRSKRRPLPPDPRTADGSDAVVRPRAG